MIYLVLGFFLLLSDQGKAVTGGTSREAMTIGSYRLIETTKLYPKSNRLYGQFMDCGQDPTPGLSLAPTQGPASMATSSSPSALTPTPPSLADINSAVGGGGQNNTPPMPGTISEPDSINLDPNFGNMPVTNPVGGVGTGYYPGNGNGISLDQIVNIGNIIWSIIDMGRPNVRGQTYRAHALPRGIVCWTDLENWQVPVSKVFSIEYKNKLNQVVAIYSYRISYVYGGSVEGIGKYIANLTVTPVDLRVSWGFNFSSQVQIPSTFNLGSKKNPLAGMQVFVFWNMGNSLKTEQKSALYFVTGDGKVQLTEAK